jgi:hypothetical protein
VRRPAVTGSFVLFVALALLAAGALAGDADLVDQTALLVTAAATDDGAGRSVAPAGDVNGDGRPDFVIGAPYTHASAAGRGSAYVVFGPAGDSPLSLGSLGARGFRIDGGSVYASAGTDVAGIGDVNKDGKDDLLIGAPHLEPPDAVAGDKKPGSAYVVYGQSDTTTVDLAKVGDTVPGVVVSSAQAPETVGVSVERLGDVNGDGVPDAAIGMGVPLGGGRVIVLFGSGATETKAIDAAALGTDGFTITGLAGSPLTGADVAGPGDVDSDGKADVLIGAPDETSGTGAAYVVHGKATTDAVSLATPGAAWHLLGAMEGDAAGTSVAAPGDIDGDGRPDLLIGAPGADPQSRTDAGAAYVVFGRAGTEGTSLGSLGAGGYVVEGPADGAAIGPVAGGGDFAGDAVRDLLIGQPSAGSGAAVGTGAVWIVPGHKGSDKVDLAAAPEGTLRLLGAEGEKIGDALAGGDLDGAGRPDFLTGAQALPDGGRVRVRLGGSLPPAETATATATPTPAPSAEPTPAPTEVPVITTPLTAPVLEVDAPSAGASTIPIDGTVTAPSGLSGVSVTIDPDDGPPVGPVEIPTTCLNCGQGQTPQEPATAMPPLATPVYALGPFNLNAPAGGYDLDYHVTPAGGLASSDTTFHLPAVPVEAPTGNLWIAGLEVNQAIQSYTNMINRNELRRFSGTLPVPTYPSAIPTIARKPTVVRVFVRYEKYAPGGVEATVKLYGMRGNTQLPHSPIAPVTAVQPVHVTSVIEQQKGFDSAGPIIDSSFLFELPQEWLGPLPVRLRAEVKGAPGFPECPGCKDGANVLETRVGFKQTSRVFIELWAFKFASFLADGNHNAFDFIRKTYPLAPGDLIVKGAANGKPLGPIAMGLPNIETAYELIPDPDEDRFSGYGYDDDEQLSAYGLVPYTPLGDLGGASGMAEMLPVDNGDQAVGFDGKAKGSTAAQEIGHNLDLNHSSCDHNESQGESILFPCDDYPGDTPLEHGMIGGTGIDTTTLEVLREQEGTAHRHDFMSYGKDKWVGTETFKRIYAFIKSGVNIPASASAAAVTRRAALALSGTVGADGSVTLGRSHPVRGVIPTGKGAMVAVVLDGAGKEIARAGFDGSVTPHGRVARPFKVLVPDLAALRRVEFRDGAGTLLGASDAAASAPVVKVTSRAGAIGREGTSTVRFTVSGSGNPAAAAWLELSNDRGRNWETIAEAPAGGGAVGFDAAGIARTRSGRLRVVVADGLRHAVALVPGTLRAPNHPPSIERTAPFEDFVHLAGRPVTLAIAGSDLEDGEVAGRRVTWRSDRDGVLGTGRELTVSTLSIGRHAITAVARDADGAASRPVTVHVRVGALIARVAGLPLPETVRPTVKVKGARLVFSEPVVGLGSKQVRLGGPFAVGVAAGGTEIRLRPAGRARGRRTVRLSGVTDLQGNPLGARTLTLRF